MLSIHHETANGRPGYSFEEFGARFLEICEEHRKDSRGLAFAFILYDFTQPEIAKMLRDDEYWRALHEISGQALTVFSLHVAPVSAVPAREVRFMTAVGPVGDPGLKTGLLLQSHFGLVEKIDLPAVLFFQTDDDQVTSYYLVRLFAREIEAAFAEVRDLLMLAAETASKKSSGPDNAPEDIMAAVVRSLRKRNVKLNAMRGLRALKEIKDAVGLVSMFG